MAEVRAAAAPPERISVPYWADTYRVLPKESSRKYGVWDTSHVEVARGPMLAVTEPGVRIITLMSCTQLMKTDFLLNVFGYYAHTRPAPILFIQPKDDSASSFSKERLTPMIRETPVLRALVGTGKMRKSDETIFYKAFPGGFAGVVGAGSPDNLARRPIALALADECDKYPITREGDPFTLIGERLATYGAESLFVRACSPTVEDESRIADSYAESDQRKASVACPSCGHRQFLDFFKHVDWVKTRNADGDVTAHLTKTARIHCEDCGEAWSEGTRLIALQSIRWHQTKTFTCCDRRHSPLDDYERSWRLLEEVKAAAAAKTEELAAEEVDAYRAPTPDESVGRVWDWWEDKDEGRYAVYLARCPDCSKHPVETRHAGFQASKLYSPWELDQPHHIAKKWMDAKGKPDLELAWWNTQMGLPHKPTAGRIIAVQTLLDRREAWDAEVPDGVAFITSGFDVQEDRVEYEVVGWGRDEESWSLEYGVIEGNFKDPATQRAVDDVILRRWRRADGETMAIKFTCIDSGFNTQAVYQFTKARLGRKVFAIKGASEKGGERNPVWPTKKVTTKNRSSYKPILIGGNTARDVVRARLALDPPTPTGRVEAGYCHFPADRDLVFFEQLLADRLVLKEQGGRRFRVWETPSNKANEASDCRAYNYAALCGAHHYGLRLNVLVARQAARRLTPVEPIDDEVIPPQQYPTPPVAVPPTATAAQARTLGAGRAPKGIVSRLA